MNRYILIGGERKMERGRDGGLSWDGCFIGVFDTLEAAIAAAHSPEHMARPFGRADNKTSWFDIVRVGAIGEPERLLSGRIVGKDDGVLCWTSEIL